MHCIKLGLIASSITANSKIRGPDIEVQYAFDQSMHFKREVPDCCFEAAKLQETESLHLLKLI